MNDEQRAQWEKIDKVQQGLALVQERIARVEGHIDSIEQRVEWQHDAICQNRKEAKREFDALMQELSDLQASVNQARGGIRVGRVIACGLLAIAGAAAALKAGDMSGAWHALTGIFRGGE